MTAKATAGMGVRGTLREIRVAQNLPRFRCFAGNRVAIAERSTRKGHILPEAAGLVLIRGFLVEAFPWQHRSFQGPGARSLSWGRVALRLCIARSLHHSGAANKEMTLSSALRREKPGPTRRRAVFRPDSLPDIRFGTDSSSTRYAPQHYRAHIEGGLVFSISRLPIVIIFECGGQTQMSVFQIAVQEQAPLKPPLSFWGRRSRPALASITGLTA